MLFRVESDREALSRLSSKQLSSSGDVRRPIQNLRDVEDGRFSATGDRHVRRQASTESTSTRTMLGEAAAFPVSMHAPRAARLRGVSAGGDFGGCSYNVRTRWRYSIRNNS
jgi:hypothetical protein